MTDAAIIEDIKRYGGLGWLRVLARDFVVDEKEMRASLERLAAEGEVRFYPIIGEWAADLAVETSGLDLSSRIDEVR